MPVPSVQTRLDEATRFVKYIMQRGSIHELRANTGDGFISGRYTDPVLMAQHAIALQEKHGVKAVYYGLNAAKPDAKFGAKELNTMQRRPGAAAKDSSIERRSLYAIDIDSAHDKDRMATEDQHLETIALAHRVVDLIRKHIPEFPHPIWVHSGNGTHLIWRGDNCDASSPAWRYILRHIAAQVVSPGAKVDASVFSAGQILRLPGSINCKGPDTPDTPHRMARVTRYPTTWTPVEHGPHVYRLARALGFSEETERQQAGAGGIEGDASMVIELIGEYPEMLTHLGTAPDDGEKVKVLIAECPFVGRRHAGGNSAFLVYNDGTVRYKCFAESCPGQGFGSLLRLLRERTGRESQAFRHDRPLTARELEAWGEVEEAELYAAAPEAAAVSTIAVEDEETEPIVIEPEAAAAPLTAPVEFASVKAWNARHPRTMPDAIKGMDLTKVPLSSNPEAWGLKMDDVWPTFSRMARRDQRLASDPVKREEIRLRYARVIDAQDLQEMGRMLGGRWLATLADNKRSRPEMPTGYTVSAAELVAFMEVTAGQRHHCPAVPGVCQKISGLLNTARTQVESTGITLTSSHPRSPHSPREKDRITSSSSVNRSKPGGTPGSKDIVWTA